MLFHFLIPTTWTKNDEENQQQKNKKEKRVKKKNWQSNIHPREIPCINLKSGPISATVPVPGIIETSSVQAVTSDYFSQFLLFQMLFFRIRTESTFAMCFQLRLDVFFISSNRRLRTGNPALDSGGWGFRFSFFVLLDGGDKGTRVYWKCISRLLGSIYAKIESVDSGEWKNIAYNHCSEYGRRISLFLVLSDGLMGYLKIIRWFLFWFISVNIRLNLKKKYMTTRNSEFGRIVGTNIWIAH